MISGDGDDCGVVMVMVVMVAIMVTLLVMMTVSYSSLDIMLNV